MKQFGLWVLTAALVGCGRQAPLADSEVASQALVASAPQVISRPADSLIQEPEDLKTLRSLTGMYALTIGPTNNYGGGEGDYVMRKEGAVVWQSHLPFFLYQAAIAGDGTVFGYAYTTGAAQFAPGGSGSLEVWRIDAAGKTQKLKSFERMFMATDSPAYPMGEQPVLHEENDVAMIPVVGFGEDFEDFSTKNLLYKISTGDAMGEWKPALKTSDSQWMYEPMAGIAGTELTLAPSSDQKHTVHLNLIDLSGQVVWSKDFPVSEKDDTVPIFTNGYSRILPNPHSGQFLVAIGKEQVEFRAEKLGTDWKITETGRKTIDADAERKAAKESIPRIKAMLTKTVVLKDGKAPSAATKSGVFNLMLAGSDLLVYEQGRTEKRSLTVCDKSGKVLRTIKLDSLPHGPKDSILIARVGSDLLAIDNKYGDVRSTACWKINPASGAVTPLQVPAGVNGSDRMTRFSDGTWVSYATGRQSVNAYDNSGKQLWSIPLEEAKGSLPEIYSPEAMTVDSAGHLLLADGITNHVYVFSRLGKFLRAIDLKPVFKTDMNYISDIEADVNGGFILYNFGNDEKKDEPTMYRMAADGKLVAAFRRHYANGQPLDAYGIVQIDSQGRIWSHDGFAIAELDKTGAVKKTLGEEPKSTTLTRIRGFELGPHGEAYLLDERTLALHAFNVDGTQKYIFQPAPKQLIRRDMMMGGVMSLDADGTMHIYGGDKGEVVVTSDGKFGGYWGDPPREYDLFGCSYRGAPGFRWTPNMRLNGIDLRDKSGKTVLNAGRRPDGGLMGRPDVAYTAPDGSICVETSTIARNFLEDEHHHLSIFGVHGEPVSTVTPPSWMGDNLAGFDGKHVFMLDEDDDLICCDNTGKPIWLCPKSEFGKSDIPTISWDGTQVISLDGMTLRFYTFQLPQG